MISLVMLLSVVLGSVSVTFGVILGVALERGRRERSEMFPE